MPAILRQHTGGNISLEKDRSDATLAEVEGEAVRQSWIRKALTRPMRMFLEPVVLLTDLYLLYQYSILFLYFEAYPIIFQGM